jgi:hypothetical protein
MLKHSYMQVLNSCWKSYSRPITCSCIFISLVYLSFRIFFLIDLHSVNILFWDQWDFYSALFNGGSWGDLFRWQYGPHRQGLGLMLTKIVAGFSGWNTRSESFVIGAILSLAAIFALGLKVRLFRSLALGDIIIFLLVLTPAQAAIFYNTPNPSHAALPLLLLMVYCLFWTIPLHLWRYSLILLANIAMIYTGFAIFAGILTPALLVVEYLISGKRPKSKVAHIIFGALVLSLLSMGSFFIGYKFDPAVPNFQLLHPQYWKYAQLVFLFFAKFFGETGIDAKPMLVGASLCLAAVLICGVHIKKLYSGNPAERMLSRTIVILIAFSLLFSFNMAFGRISLGLHAAQVSRYVTFLIPAYLGVYFHLLTLPQRRIRMLLTACGGVVLIILVFPVRDMEVSEMKRFSNGKIRWQQVYLATEDIELTQHITGFPIHPTPFNSAVPKKLAYLKARKLNLYQAGNGRAAPDRPFTWGILRAFHVDGDMNAQAAFATLEKTFDIAGRKSAALLAPVGCGLKWEGWMLFDETGLYRFTVNSDGNTALWIDGNLMLSRTAPQTEAVSAACHLDQGVYPVKLIYGRHNGCGSLAVRWTPPPGNTRQIPAFRLFDRQPDSKELALRRATVRLARMLWVSNCLP